MVTVANGAEGLEQLRQARLIQKPVLVERLLEMLKDGARETARATRSRR